MPFGILLAMEVTFHPPSTLIRLVENIHANTPMTKAARVTLDVVGALAIVTSVTLFSAVELPMLGAGILIIVITEIAYFALEVLGLIATDISDRVFEPKNYRNSSLTYMEGDVPILTIDAESDYEKGFDHGYLVAPYLMRIISRIRLVSFFIGYLQPSALGNKLRAIKASLPQNVKDELTGLIAGVKQWDLETSFFTPFPLTEDELLTYQLLPDLLHFFLPHILVWGCSSVANYCPNTGDVHIGRHLDWPSLGVFGKYSVLIHKKGSRYVSFAIPGLLGVLTGVKADGTFISMNVSPPRALIQDVPPGSLPSTFFCRKVLEEDDANNLTPLAPFHMVIADHTGAHAHHFRQGRDGNTEVVRRLQRNAGPLITLNNIHYNEHDENTDMFFGTQRKANILYHTKRNSPLSTAMQSPYVNNSLTIHSLRMNLRTRELTYYHSNGCSASFPHRRINLQEIFR